MFSSVSNYSHSSALAMLQSINDEMAVIRNRMSSGKAVSSARDDGAIASIAQRKISQKLAILTMQAGMDRTSGAIDVSVAAGHSVMDMLLDMREKAVAATSSGLSAGERFALQADFDATRKRINPMVASAEFNGIDLVSSVSGGFDLTTSFQPPAAERPQVARVAPHTTLRMQFIDGGSKLLFASGYANLVPGDINGAADVFIKDLSTGVSTRINTRADGTQPNGMYNNAEITSATGANVSPDGTKILMQTKQALVAGDTNNNFDVYMKDIVTGAITLVSSDAGGLASSAHHNLQDLRASFSPDGTKVVFQSEAAGLVSEDTNGFRDIFVKELASGAITRVSTTAAGAQVGNSSQRAIFSPDGSKILFDSVANEFPGETGGSNQIYLKDLITGQVTAVSTNASGNQLGSNIYHVSHSGVFSPDGTKIVFVSNLPFVAEDTNGKLDIFVKDLASGAVTRVSTGAGGGQADGDSQFAVFSPDGKSIAFMSHATNLVADDTNGVQDVFLKDLVTGGITRLSMSSEGVQANGSSGGPVTFVSEGYGIAFSPDGQSIAFHSAASNLVYFDTNGAHADVFVATLPPNPNTAIRAYDWRIGGGGALSQISSASGLLNTAASAAAVVVAIDNAVKALGRDLSSLAGQGKALEHQHGSLTKLYDVFDAGVSRLVDADLGKESARLAALKVKQRLTEEALALSNRSYEVLLSLLPPSTYRASARTRAFEAYV